MTGWERWPIRNCADNYVLTTSDNALCTESVQKNETLKSLILSWSQIFFLFYSGWVLWNFLSSIRRKKNTRINESVEVFRPLLYTLFQITVQSVAYLPTQTEQAKPWIKSLNIILETGLEFLFFGVPFVFRLRDHASMQRKFSQFLLCTNVNRIRDAIWNKHWPVSGQLSDRCIFTHYLDLNQNQKPW